MALQRFAMALSRPLAGTQRRVNSVFAAREVNASASVNFVVSWACKRTLHNNGMIRSGGGSVFEVDRLSSPLGYANRYPIKEGCKCESLRIGR